MRRRPSGSGDDDDAAKSPSTANSSSDRQEKGRDTLRETSRGKERKQSREWHSSRGQDQASTPSSTHRSALASPAAVERSPVNAPRTKDMAGAQYKAQRARLRGPWSCSLLTLTTTVASVVLLFTIIRSFLTLQLDPKGCAMSYMRPSFAHFDDFDTEHTRFASKYSLYLYREGGVDEDTRVKGIPVLFIPGNAGSYKQVRPIAAEAAHYFHDVLKDDLAAVSGGKRPLDFFTVDFNEELTAFHGQTLLDQAEYLNEAIAYILALYHNPHRSLREPGLPDPKSVIVLGHSMGGIVARTMLRMPNYQDKTINTIVTLSAPHARPPISFDAEMVSTYNDINTFWRESYLAVSPTKNPLADVTLVSVAGGGLDTMIPSEFSSLTSLVPDTHGFTVFTSAIPCVWTGTDHLAIMWCDQFRKALVKAVFDVVDVRRSSMTLPQLDRVRALRKRLLTGMETVVEKGSLEHEPTTFLTLEHRATAFMSHGERLQLRTLGDSGNFKAHVMPIPSQPAVQGSKFTLLTDQTLEAVHDNGSVTVLLCSVFPPANSAGVKSLVINLNTGDDSTASTRLACKNAAADLSLLPRSTKESREAFDGTTPFSYLQYDLSEIANHQFIAVVDKTTEPTPGWLLAEFSTAAQSTIAVDKGHHQLLMSGLQEKLPFDRPMMNELKIPEVHSTMFAYRLEVKRTLQGSCEEKFTPLLRQYIQEPYESKYFVNTEGGNINVHGISPYMPPPLRGGDASEGLSLQLWTDPTCNSTVDVSLQVDVLGSAGKLVMRYRTAFAAFPILVVAIVLRKQFKVYDATGSFISFSQSMDQCIRTSLPVIFTALSFLSVSLSKATQGPWTRPLLNLTATKNIDFTVNDLMLGTPDPFFWFLVPLFGVISVGVCMAANYLILSLIHVLAFLYGGVRSLILRKDDGRRQPTTSSYNRRVFTTGVLLLLVMTVIPYQFAYLVLCLVQVASAVGALRNAQDGTAGQGYNLYNYVHSMLILMLGILPINMPVLVVWVHNLAVHWLTPFSTHHNLTSVLPLLLLVETMSTAAMVPRASPRVRYLTNVFLFAFALYAAVYGVTYAYRLHHMVNGLAGWLFLLHMSNGPFSPARWLPGVSSRSNSAPHNQQSDSRGDDGRDVKKRP